MSAMIFMIKRSEVEKRLDPFFYRPDFMQLENAVKKAGALPLRNYVRAIASGATPKTDEYEKYYSDKHNGIPFLRVQNLSPTSILNYEDCKYINKETHENMLYRSQVNEGDLLVKITGVGRMAIASVAPKGFVGNTNQHMCVIKTADEKTSWILASWLNTDIAEKLASRRATGGTRPALDYPALLSIPIIFDERIYETMKKAVSEMKKKQEQAKELLASIDSYLLSELGITLPQKDNSLSKRIFTTKFSEVSGERLDVYYYNTFFTELERQIKKLKVIKFGEVINSIINGLDYREYDSRGIPYLKVANVKSGELFIENLQYIDISAEEVKKDIHLKKGNLLLTRKGTFGNAFYIKEDMDYLISSEIFYIDIKSENIDGVYLENLLNSTICQSQFDRIKIGAIMGSLTQESVKNITIPFPSLSKQKKIAEHIHSIRTHAKQLQIEAEQILQDAKNQVEKMILGE